MPLFRRDFKELLLEAVDEGLSLLGESSKQAIYYHLERSFNIKKEEIPDRIMAFAQAIENIFGEGAHLIEILTMKKLSEKVGSLTVQDGCERCGFIEYVAKAERVFRERNLIKTVGELVECEETEPEV